MFLRVERKYCGQNGGGGFTLVELLLAIFIFSIVISTVYGSYRATFHVVNGTEKKMTTAAKAHVVLDRIVDDISSLIQGKGGYLTGTQHEISGMRGDDITFVSAVHIGFVKEDNLAGYATIEYSTEIDEVSGLINLYRSDSPQMPGIAETEDKEGKYLLCDGLKEVRFLYFDDDGAESEEWLNQKEESEEGGQVFPVMVTVVLQFADTPESKEISIFTTSVALTRING